MQKDSVLYQQLKAVIEEKKVLRNPLIEILHKAQDIFGYLPMEVQEFVAEELNMPVNKVYGVVTFYNAFTMKPRGKYVINVCTGTACYVKGAQAILNEIEKKYGLKPGQVTSDNKFGVQVARCIGACGLAPAVVIDEEVHGKLTAAEIHEKIHSKIAVL